MLEHNPWSTLWTTSRDETCHYSQSQGSSMNDTTTGSTVVAAPHSSPPSYAPPRFYPHISYLPVLSEEPKPNPQVDVSQIPRLSTLYDFPAWEGIVTAIVASLGLYGHLLDPAKPVSQTECMGYRPRPRPTLSASPTQAELYALRRWSLDEATVYYVLTVCLGSVARYNLPPPTAPARFLPSYKVLRKMRSLFSQYDIMPRRKTRA